MMLTCALIAMTLMDTQEVKTWHAFKMTDIDGVARPMSDYKGKVVLVVNTASQCGLTPQYAGLEALYRKYKDKGFVIVGFPCNDFNGQEPGTEAEIKQFCTGKYDVTFPMYSKIHVKGSEQAPMYKWLIEKTDGKDVEWNFGKFLVDKEGHVLGRFPSKMTPEDPTVVAAVEKALSH